MKSILITIAGFEIAVQVLDTCPLDATEITARVQAVYDQYRCQPTRDDIVWAVGKAGDIYCTETIIATLPNTALQLYQGFHQGWLRKGHASLLLHQRPRSGPQRTT
jgi:hypothetical protein